MNDIKVHILHCGKVLVDRALPFQEKTWHPLPQTGWFRSTNKKMWVPVSAYLIEHPKGFVLVDTGWSEEIRENYKKHVGWLTSTMFKGELSEGESISEQLKKLGISPKELEYVVITHMHSDHISGITHVKEAKKIIVSKKEWEIANKQIGYVKSMWREIEFEKFDFEKGNTGPYGLSFDLFNDDTIQLVYTPGHARGQVSVLVQKNDGFILLASDVGYAERSWKEMILPGHLDNKKEAYQSLKWIKHMSEQKNCIEVIANHDTNVIPKII